MSERSPLLDDAGRLISPFLVPAALRDQYRAEILRRLQKTDPADVRVETQRFRALMREMLADLDSIEQGKTDYAWLLAFHDAVFDLFDEEEYAEIVAEAKAILKQTA